MTDLDRTAPDFQFLSDCIAIAPQILWDPHEGPFGGYAVNDVDDDTAAHLRRIARTYGMRMQHYREQRACWISRKNAVFDRS